MNALIHFHLNVISKFKLQFQNYIEAFTWGITRFGIQFELDVNAQFNLMSIHKFSFSSWIWNSILITYEGFDSILIGCNSNNVSFWRLKFGIELIWITCEYIWITCEYIDSWSTFSLFSLGWQDFSSLFLPKGPNLKIFWMVCCNCKYLTITSFPNIKGLSYLGSVT